MKRYLLLTIAAVLALAGIETASAQSPPYPIICVLPSTPCPYPGGAVVTNSGDAPYVWAGKDNANFSALFANFGSSATPNLGTPSFLNLSNATGLPAAAIPASGVTAGTYGSATQVPAITIGTDGRVTSASNVPITVTYPDSVQTPTTGFSITIGGGVSVLVLNPAGTLATGTLTMPASPTDKQNVCVTSSQTITALTVNANAGQSIIAAPTGMSAGGFCYHYVLSLTTWFRLY